MKDLIGRLRSRGSRRAIAAAAALGMSALVLLATRPQHSARVAEGRRPAAPARRPTASAIPAHRTTAQPIALPRCPWLASAMNSGASRQALADLVLQRMTLSEKLGEIVLRPTDRYENSNEGVPRLCIPPLILQDGPAGIAYGATGVTQMPAPIALAATFDPTLAESYGQVLGSEARTKGIDVVQGPDLNLTRVPESGRSFEGFGEDPFLAAAMGVAEIRGIQSTGVLAQAKHLVAYQQETDRAGLDAVVSDRTLHEIYLRPFEASVTQGHVGTIMCAYPELDGVPQCEDPALTATVRAWGFDGLVRTDLGAARDPVAALRAGVDLIKPASVANLAAAVHAGRLPVSVVDHAVRDILVVMFRLHLVGAAPGGNAGVPADNPAHARIALQVAQRSIVLLQNSNGILPLSPLTGGPIALIGTGATSPTTRGGGSSAVRAPFVSSPLDAIRARLAGRRQVLVADGGTGLGPYPVVPATALAPVGGRGHGLTLTLTTIVRGHSGKSILVRSSVVPRPEVRLTATAAHPESKNSLVPFPLGAESVVASLRGNLTPPSTGLYSFSLWCTGSATMTLDGVPVPLRSLDGEGGNWSAATPLRAGHAYRLDIRWSPFGALGSKAPNYPRGAFLLGWQDDTPAIEEAVALAKRAATVVVFASDSASEGFDRPNLDLPGDQNALISAVAAANPRTIVVLTTSGAVRMPWLGRVPAVLEAWYPGENAGAALASVLFGDVDPGGRLPVTFPADDGQVGLVTPSQWPGVGLTATYSEGLDLGYRFVNAHGTTPIFPFGYGLSYTTFTMHDLHAAPTTGGYAVSLTVTNTGHRPGIAVPEFFLTFPTAAHEPPRQLVGFASVDIPAGASTRITVPVVARQFMSYVNGRWMTWPGSYTLNVGWSSQESESALPLTAPSG